LPGGINIGNKMEINVKKFRGLLTLNNADCAEDSEPVGVAITEQYVTKKEFDAMAEVVKHHNKRIEKSESRIKGIDNFIKKFL